MAIRQKTLEGMGIAIDRWIIVKNKGKKFGFGQQKVESCDVYRWNLMEGKLYKTVSSDKTTPKDKKDSIDLMEETVGVNMQTFKATKEYVEIYHPNAEIEESSKEDAFLAAL